MHLRDGAHAHHVQPHPHPRGSHHRPLGPATASRLRFRRALFASFVSFGIIFILLFAFTGSVPDAAPSMTEDAGGASGQGSGGVLGWLFAGVKRRRKRRLWHPKFPGMGRREQKYPPSGATAEGAAAAKGDRRGNEAASHTGVANSADDGAIPEGKHRIAIVIPYLPPPQTQTGGATAALPPYFPVFARTAGGSASLVDFLIFHDGSIPAHLLPPSKSSADHDPYAEEYSLPPNVKLIDVGGIEGMAKLFLRVADERIKSGELEMDEERLTKLVGRHIRGKPYVLVEFKAAYGHIFEDYLKAYTHWGYSDFDVAFGNLPRWVSPDELTDYDIVTYGYGDQDRAYLRGQFTFHKNTAKTRQIWRGCSFLSEIDKRFARAAAGEEKLQFESAEGCYSHVVLHRNDLTVKYAVKALNDLGDEGDTAYTHGLYIGVGSNGDRSVVWKAGPNHGDGVRLRDLPLNWFEAPGSPYADVPGQLLQREVGKRVRIHSHRDKYGDNPPKGKEANCMFWAPKSYQPDICLVDVDSTDTVFLVNGILYKQPFEQVEMPGNVVSLSFYHFMEWKRYYRPMQLATMARAPTDGGIGGWVLSGEGAVPLPPASSVSSMDSRQKSLGSTWDGPAVLHRHHASVDDRTRFPPSPFCIRSSQRKVPPRPAVAQCDYFTSWRDAEGVRIVHEGEDRTKGRHAVGGDESTVTLVLTLELSMTSLKPSKTDLDAADGLLALAESNVQVWSQGGQPSVLVIYVGVLPDELEILIHERFGAKGRKDKANKRHLALSLVAIISPTNVVGKDNEKDVLVSRNALQNFAEAAAQTRWVIAGLDLDRGLVLSTEAVGFAHRTAKFHSSVEGVKTGLAFVVPQLAAREKSTFDEVKVENPAGSVSLSRLLSTGMVLKDSVVTPELSLFDCVRCSRKKRNHDPSHEKNIVRRVLELWLKMTQNELSESALAEFVIKEAFAEKEEIGRSIEELERAVLRLLMPKNFESLRQWDSSPIVMLDRNGPWSGVRTFEVAPEVEEFGGGSGPCFKGLRLAHLVALGYHLTILPGAFAMSTTMSRELACAGSIKGDQVSEDASKCADGCSMFKSDVFLEDMAYDERIRAAKAAVLWSELESTMHVS